MNSNNEKVLKEGKIQELTKSPSNTNVTPMTMLNIAPKPFFNLAPVLGPSTTALNGLNRFRSWNLVFLNDKIKEEYEKDLKVEITLKIRGEEATSFVPDKLYSSHKYIVEHKLKGSIKNKGVLVTMIQVVHPNTNEEILKKDKSQILIGSLETALVSPKKDDDLQGKMRIQFSDVSYHHDKGYFAFRISYYETTNLKEPIFILKSPSFRVYARKPSISRETLQPEKVKEIKKRKKKDETSTVIKTKTTTTSSTSPSPKKETTVTTDITSISPSISPSSSQTTETSILPPLKKQKMKSKDFQEFQRKLDSLVLMKSNLSEQDRQLANETSLEKLLSIDPTYTLDLFVKNENNVCFDFSF
eukprot:gene2830-4237_t